MLFNSFDYLVFLPLVVAVNWLLPARLRPVWLVAASYYFYAFWNPPFLLLIFGLTLFNYVLGLHQGRRGALLALAIVVDLGALGLFKYLGFLDANVQRLAIAFHVPASLPVLQLVLPLGLSFFTFEFIHYQVDIYRGHKPILNPVEFALFPAFFPTQISGPIKRYQDFNGQVQRRPGFSPAMFMEGLELVALGLFKKVVIADALMTPVTSVVYAHVGQASATDAWLNLIAFYMQVYFDFSGYTDIGRGSAQLLGYHVPLNFRSPQLATSIREFWHRWHMTLAFWLRDYVFVPVGRALRRGDRRNSRPWHTPVNVLITFTLGGLWHGAGWNFVLWGFTVGAAYDFEQAYKERRTAPLLQGLPGVLAAWFVTQFSMMALVQILRSNHLSFFYTLFWKCVTGGVHSRLLTSLQVVEVIGVFVTLIGVQLLMLRWHPRDLLARSGTPAEVVLRPAYVLSLVGLFTYFFVLAGESHRFFYYQF